MSTIDVEARALELYDALNARDFQRVRSVAASEVEVRNAATGDVYRGHDGFLKQARAWAAAFPDGRVEVVRIDSTERSVTVELLLRGTHAGTLTGLNGQVPPTWCSVELEMCEILTFRGENVTLIVRYFDTGSLLRQMGLAPSSPLHAPDRRATLELYAEEPESLQQHLNKEVVRAFVEQTMNRGAPGAAADSHAIDVVLHGGPFGDASDLLEYQRHIAALLLAFPDLAMDCLEMVAETDRVAARYTVSGTHKGPFHGIPPTGKHVRASCACSYRLVNGLVAEEWWHHDLFGLLLQIDAIPARLGPVPR